MVHNRHGVKYCIAKTDKNMCVFVNQRRTRKLYYIVLFTCEIDKNRYIAEKYGQSSNAHPGHGASFLNAATSSLPEHMCNGQVT